MKLFQKENCVEITSKLLTLLNVSVTAATLEKDLFHHPDYPSLLSISDILLKYGVENVSIKTKADNIRQIPLPCIIPIKSINTGKDFFTIIKGIDQSGLTYYDPEKNRWQHCDFDNFQKLWPSGIALLSDAENAYGEEDFTRSKKKEKIKKISQFGQFLALPILALISIIIAFFQHGNSAIMPSVYLLLNLAGCTVSGLLLWYELDEYNPVLQQICSTSKKVNCGAILNSEASKIAGISWSVIGFVYFAGGLFTQLSFGLTNTVALYVLAWLNTLAVPYVFFSVYYQWRIAKQWCVLCLCVQALLILQLVSSVGAGWHTLIPWSVAVKANQLLLIILAFMTPLIAISLLSSAYRLAKESKKNHTELQRLKHNPQIFDALLRRQKKISDSTQGLGIILGNPQATQKIIKVCNPYCGPCASAHQPMEELLRNNPDLQVQIIFTATNDEADIRSAPAKHLLAIADRKNEDTIKKALDDWYLADTKSYSLFAQKYPMDEELKQQNTKVEAMDRWCKTTEIAFTPTFFVNGYQLPEMYSVSDLSYFLSV